MRFQSVCDKIAESKFSKWKVTAWQLLLFKSYMLAYILYDNYGKRKELQINGSKQVKINIIFCNLKKRYSADYIGLFH